MLWVGPLGENFRIDKVLDGLTTLSIKHRFPPKKPSESLSSLLPEIKFEPLLAKYVRWMLILDCWELNDLRFPVTFFFSI